MNGCQYPTASKSIRIQVQSIPRSRRAFYFGDHDFGFTLVDRIRLEGLAFYLGDHDFSFALVDRVRLETLAVYFGDHDFNFTLVDRVRLEGLAFYFGDDDFGFALIDRVRLKGLAAYLRRWRLRPSPSSIQSDWRGSPSTFGDGDFGLLPRRQNLT